MIQRVLVVGGAGYIGGSVSDQLLSRNIPFTVYDNLTYENHYLKPVDFIYGDIRDQEKLGTLLPHYSHVVWLAALVGDGACAIKPDLTKQINQEPLEWLARVYGGRIIFTSTCSVYGANEAAVSETSAIQPLSMYAQTKHAAEQYLLNKDALIFRLGTAFGIPDTFSRIRMDLAINYLTMNAMTRGDLTIFGGQQWRPFIHVKDIGNIIVNSLDTGHRGVFNLATQNITMNTVGELIQRETGCSIETKAGEFSDPRNYNADTSKARLHGILPEVTPFDIRYGISEMKSLVCSDRVRNLRHEIYSNEKYILQAVTQYENGFKPFQNVGADKPALRQTSESHLDSEPRLIDGGLAVDDRGETFHVNDFTFKNVKRFYVITNHTPGFIRAWHGHKQAAKFVFVISGAALIGAVKIDNFDNPNPAAPVSRFVLSQHKPAILYIPPGYANGAMTLSADAKIVYFATDTLSETHHDDWRYNAHYWDIWQVEKR